MIRKLHSTDATPPKSSAAVFKTIKQILKSGWNELPSDNNKFYGTGAPGNYLEFLAGVKANNNDWADLQDWELKFHGGSGGLMTLLHKSPEPRGIMRHVVHDWGYIANDQITLRHTIRGESDRGFYVTNEPDRISIRNNRKDIVVPYWTHNTLLNAAGKIKRLVVVDGEYQSRTRKVIYKSAIAFWGFRITEFCDAVVDGTVAIEFDARTTKGHGSVLRDHGTKFRIKREDIHHLYENSRKIT